MTKLETKAAGITALYVLAAVSFVTLVAMFPLYVFLTGCAVFALILVGLATGGVYLSEKEKLEEKERR